MYMHVHACIHVDCKMYMYIVYTIHDCRYRTYSACMCVPRDYYIVGVSESALLGVFVCVCVCVCVCCVCSS